VSHPRQIAAAPEHKAYYGRHEISQGPSEQGCEHPPKKHHFLPL